MTDSRQISDNPSTLTYNANTVVNFNEPNVQTESLTGDVSFTTSNRAVGKQKAIRIISDSSTRNFTFPAWVFIGGTAPTSIAASKSAILSIYCFGTNETDIIASYSVQS